MMLGTQDEAWKQATSELAYERVVRNGSLKHLHTA